jgi:hypothetical protein
MDDDDEPDKLNIGFKDDTAFCLHIEYLMIDHSFDSYIETLTWYLEYESDVEPDQLAKHLNKKLKDCLAYEAIQLNLLKNNYCLISLFD